MIEIKVVNLELEPPPPMDVTSTLTDVFLCVAFCLVMSTIEYVPLRVGCMAVMGLVMGLYRAAWGMWRRRAEVAWANQRKLLEAMEQNSRRQLESAFGGVLEEFYKDTPIQNYVMRLVDGKFAIKVGDDECMVDIDMQKMQHDPAAAMEQAHMDWLQAKNEQCDPNTEN